MAASEAKRQPSNLSPFSRLLRSLRTGADLTQEELAERAGVSARLISDLERGRIQRPRRDTIQMLADGLELSGDERQDFVEIARGRAASSEPDTATSTLERRINLPLAPASIVGREREVTATTSLLHQPEVRLLTLTGAGGVGKTRLALEAAARIADTFADGVVFVDLAPVADPALVIPTMARALGVRHQGQAPALEQLVEAIQDRQLLVVLDNLEHLVAAAPEIAQLLERCPELTLLATSRQPLRLRAEREYPVAPLALPDLKKLPPQDELSRIPAIDLFVRRAEAVRPSFALTADNAAAIAEIAVRLDGLPLAIELAAARVRVLSPAELLSRLEHSLPLLTGGAADLPARQQTLRATIDWSHEILDEAERRLFRRLAVFAGGFTLHAAEVVAGGDATQPDEPHDVLDILTSLIDKSLLRALPPPDDGGSQTVTRFGMLETLREYSLEQLAASGEEAEARTRHAHWCVDLVERADPELSGPNQQEWFNRLEAERDNIRAALNWAVEQGQSEIALRLCGSLYRFWVTAAHYAEGRQWTERALKLGPKVTSKPRADSLLGLGVIAYFQGDYERAEAHTEEALATFDAIGDRAGFAYSYANLGLFADVREDYDRAIERYEHALSVFQEMNDAKHSGFMYGNLGLIFYFQGNYERADDALQASLTISRARGDGDGSAITLGNLALVALARGNPDSAEDLQRQSLELRKKLVNRSHLARNFDQFGHIAAARHEPERAVRLFAAADALRTEIGAPLQPNDQVFNDRCIRELKTRLGDAAFRAAWKSGAAMSPNEAIAFALRAEQRTEVHDIPSPHHDD